MTILETVFGVTDKVNRLDTVKVRKLVTKAGVTIVEPVISVVVNFVDVPRGLGIVTWKRPSYLKSES